MELPERWLLFICFVYFLPMCSSFSVTGETSLRTALLTSYSTEVRPTAVTEVQIAFNILSINEMNIRDQRLSAAGWFTLVWVDPRLAWTPSSYSNVTDIHTDDDDIWYPVLVIDNGVKSLAPIESDSVPMRITSDGTVRWAPPGIITTSCDMDPTYFPFDKHICYIQVTSFGYTLNELNLTIKGDGMITDYYQLNGEWQLISHSASRSEFFHDGHPYSRVLLELGLRRLPNFHGINLILPVIINSVLVPFVFKVSAESGEKIGYTLTVLLAYTVILTLLAETVPSTSIYTSLMEIYVSIVLALSTSATVLTVLIQRMYHRQYSQPVPRWLQSTVSCMARCFRHNEKTQLQPGPTPAPPSKTPIGWESRSHTSADHRVNYSWTEISLILDEFLFWMFFIIVVFLTILILILLASQH